MKMQEVVHNGRKFTIPVSLEEAFRHFHTIDVSREKRELRMSKLKHK